MCQLKRVEAEDSVQDAIRRRGSRSYEDRECVEGRIDK